MEPSETNRWERPPVGSIRLPQFLAFIGDTPAAPGLPLVILVAAGRGCSLEVFSGDLPPRSPEGYSFKDHRSSPEREHEFIEFESPVDARRVNARIHFFAGSGNRGPVGEVRIEFEGRIYAAPFAIIAHRGNQGREGRSQTPCWLDIDVPSILGLRDRGDAAAD